MNHNQTYRFWRSGGQCLIGGIAVALVTFVCFRLNVSITTAALLYLIVVALVSLGGSFLSSAVVSMIAVGCLAYYFLPPVFSFRVSDPFDVVAIITFLTTSGVITHSVTRARKSAEVLREQARLLNLTHDTIFVRDMNDVITYWNRGAEEFYGWTAEEVVSKVTTHQRLQTVFPAPLEDINEKLLRAGRWEGELRHTKRDGMQFVVASRWALQRDESGNPIAVLETNNDITERKRAEEEIRKLNDELEQRVIERTTELEAINKELQAFTYSVSHDLRAPLRHMAGYAELLQKSAASILDEKGRRYMMMILESAKRMGDLIDDLLAFSRIGRAETQKTMVSLEQLVKEALNEVRQETDGRNIGWRIGALPDLYGDRSMLRLALVNLISNAIKFTRTRPQAEIEIGCADGKEDEIVVFIRDNGVGFDMKYVNKLFGVFQRLHRAEEFEGTGIGLATVQRIIHRHGGRVWAEGLVDRGATFYFSVPKS
jgi:PAS domain S-box-containing protein